MIERTGSDDKRRVLEATDLVRLIGEHVQLRRKGREWACVCPFHDDHNPSMYVVPHKQIYHCFVCSAGGDAISFIMNFHKMGFREALQLLADKAGIELAPPPPRRALAGRASEPDWDGTPADDAASLGVSREGLLNANRAAQDFFRAILGHAEHGKAARELLERRGVAKEMIDLFGLGAAPNRWDGLGMTIASKGLDPRAFAAAGLLKQREGAGGAYDALRNRLTFPIQDALGRVIAFGGRRINDEDEPKYLNSPETLLFSKSATLYGLPMASAAIREKNQAIVTEGYMDCIACHQAGVKNVVATLGTALTPLGARVLRRLCDKIVLLFDGDDAGQRAADRAIEVLFAEPVDVRIASMSAAGPSASDAKPPKDPDELLKQPGGRERFESMIAGATDALEHRFMRLRAKTAPMGLAARSRAIDEEVARLAELGLGRISPVRRHLIVRKVAALAGVPEAVIAQAIGRQAARPFAPSRTAPAPGENPGAQLARGVSFKSLSSREQLLACVLCECALLEELSLEERAWLLDARTMQAASETAGPLAQVLQAVADASASGRAFDVREVTLRLENPAATQLAAALSQAAESATEGRPDRLHQTWADCLQARRRDAAGAAAPDDAIGKIEHLRAINQRFGPATVRIPSRSPTNF